MTTLRCAAKVELRGQAGEGANHLANSGYCMSG